MKQRAFTFFLWHIFFFCFAAAYQLSFAGTVSAIDEEAVRYQLLLAGGALKTCSSLSVSNCKDFKAAMNSKGFNLDDFKLSAEYEITSSIIEGVRQSELWNNDEQLGEKLASVLDAMRVNCGAHYTKATFIESFQSVKASYVNEAGSTLTVSGSELYRKLSDRHWYILLDYLQSASSVGKAEKVLLLNSSNEETISIFQSFVQMAKDISGKSKPTIVFLTSSSRDPFDAVSFYQQVFHQLGSKAIWLPLDPAVQFAMEKKQCNDLIAIRAEVLGSVKREIHFPQLHRQQVSACKKPQTIFDLIQQADGIFINGGDQSLTLASLTTSDGRDSKALTLIRKKMANRTLVVGGTSAGTAVQSGGTLLGATQVMISNGTSYSALKNGAKASAPPDEGCHKNNSCGELEVSDLTYRKQGGFGLIAAGIYDTHFSERARQGRLIQLALDTGARFAFGIDETTALMVAEQKNKLIYKIIGKHGVWVFDLSEAQVTKNKHKKHIRSVLSHYLSHNDILILDKQTGEVTIRFANGKKPFVQPSKKLVENDIFYRDNFRRLANSLALSNRKLAKGFTKKIFPQFRVELVKTESYKSALGFYQINSKQRAYVSYKNIKVNITKIGQ